MQHQNQMPKNRPLPTSMESPQWSVRANRTRNPSRWTSFVAISDETRTNLLANVVFSQSKNVSVFFFSFSIFPFLFLFSLFFSLVYDSKNVESVKKFRFKKVPIKKP
jgi:hypothetical protein